MHTNLPLRSQWSDLYASRRFCILFDKAHDFRRSRTKFMAPPWSIWCDCRLGTSGYHLWL